MSRQVHLSDDDSSSQSGTVDGMDPSNVSYHMPSEEGYSTGFNLATTTVPNDPYGTYYGGWANYERTEQLRMSSQVLPFAISSRYEFGDASSHGTYLSIAPHSEGPVASDVSSFSPSLRSFTSSDDPAIIHCPECYKSFQGKYRRGTLQRHVRLKHGGQEQRTYRCNVGTCEKGFLRQDARLKHQRKHHKELHLEHAMPRKHVYKSS
jgi:hypothetical protein